MKFSKDRHRWTQWLFESKRRYGLTILNYVVTSNHIHLLVVDDKERLTIPKSIQLTAGRVAQEYNQRKKRKGAYWEDRYHATAIDTGKHLLRCLVYIDLNMVRASVVSHPKDWVFGGYNDIQSPRRKCILINYDKLASLAGCSSLTSFQKLHKNLVEDALATDKNKREAHWTQSIAVGENSFVAEMKQRLGSKVLGRKAQPVQDEFQLREEVSPYITDFESEKIDISLENTYKWEVFP